jgi:hypothetical protein
VAKNRGPKIYQLQQPTQMETQKGCGSSSTPRHPRPRRQAWGATGSGTELATPISCPLLRLPSPTPLLGLSSCPLLQLPTPPVLDLERRRHMAPTALPSIPPPTSGLGHSCYKSFATPISLSAPPTLPPPRSPSSRSPMLGRPPLSWLQSPPSLGRAGSGHPVPR